MPERHPELDAAEDDDRSAGELPPADAEAGNGQGNRSGTSIIVWAVVSVALLTFVVVGSVPTYVWRFNRKYEESRSILRIWGVEVDNLPRVAHQWAIDGAFFAALAVFLIGVVVCLWFLVNAGDSSEDDRHGTAPGAS